MVSLKELRIGNYIKHSDEECMVINNTLMKSLLEYDYHKNFFPIELTYKLVENLGFVQDKSNGGKFSFKDFNFYLVQEEMTFVQCDCDGVQIGFAGLPHLHDLQNRFYSMTGIELMDVVKYRYYEQEFKSHYIDFGHAMFTFDEFVRELSFELKVRIIGGYKLGDLPPNLFNA